MFLRDFHALGRRSPRRVNATVPSPRIDGIESEFRDASPIPPDNIHEVKGVGVRGARGTRSPSDRADMSTAQAVIPRVAVVPRVNDRASGEIRPAHRPGRAEASGRRTAPRRASRPGFLPHVEGTSKSRPLLRLSQRHRGPWSADVRCHGSRLGTRPSWSDFARRPSPPRSPSALAGPLTSWPTRPRSGASSRRSRHRKSIALSTRRSCHRIAAVIGSTPQGGRPAAVPGESRSGVRWLSRSTAVVRGGEHAHDLYGWDDGDSAGANRRDVADLDRLSEAGSVEGDWRY